MDKTQICVVGTGAAGLAAALALTTPGPPVALLGPAPAQSEAAARDTRTAALLTSSVELLKAVGVFEHLRHEAAALKTIRIIDDSGSLVRGPELLFHASELGLEAFGYNIANSVLVRALHQAAEGKVTHIETGNAVSLQLTPEHARLLCDNGTEISAQLVVGADGRRSLCREAAGIAITERRYEQAALATSFSHRNPHEGVSTELYTRAGSLTTVPLVDPYASSLIWVGATAEIERLTQLDADTFAGEIEKALAGLLGSVGEAGPRTRFPVTRLTAETLGANRVALVGESGHVLPPIGAQGLNLGFRDAATLADCVADARARGQDPGSDEVLTVYARARSLDVTTRSLGVDLLNRASMTEFLPFAAARGAIMHGLRAIAPLRRLVMQAGLAPPTSLPSLMRPSS